MQSWVAWLSPKPKFFHFRKAKHLFQVLRVVSGVAANEAVLSLLVGLICYPRLAPARHKISSSCLCRYFSTCLCGSCFCVSPKSQGKPASLSCLPPSHLALHRQPNAAMPLLTKGPAPTILSKHVPGSFHNVSFSFCFLLLPFPFFA